jgi:MinD superfamily P-loop ATPase
MTHASMGPGEENSGKLVTRVRKKAREIAKDTGAHFILTDGPPGTGCAAIASVTGTDAVLLVIESSVSSLHDAHRLVELVRQFNIPLYAIINKYDIHQDTTSKIESFLANQSIPLLTKIPFDEAVIRAMLAGQSIPEYDPDSGITQMFSDARNKLFREIEVLE